MMHIYYTCEEVAKMFRVKKFTVWEWIRRKKLTAVRIGRDYRIRPEDVEDFERKRVTAELR